MLTYAKPQNETQTKAMPPFQSNRARMDVTPRAGSPNSFDPLVFVGLEDRMRRSTSCQ